MREFSSEVIHSDYNTKMFPVLAEGSSHDVLSVKIIGYISVTVTRQIQLEFQVQPKIYDIDSKKNFLV